MIATKPSTVVLSLSSMWLLLLLIASCGTYTRRSERCVNGICTTTEKRCVDYQCEIVTCSRGRCSTQYVYEGSDPAVVAGLNQKRKPSPAKIQNQTTQSNRPVFKPSADHNIWINWKRGWEKVDQSMRNPGLTHVQKEHLKDNFFKRIVGSFVSFSRLCLVDANGFSGIATFKIPVVPESGCDPLLEDSLGYYSPTIRLSRLYEDELMHYQKGKLYRARGKVVLISLTGEGPGQHLIDKFFGQYSGGGNQNYVEIEARSATDYIRNSRNRY